MNELIDRVHGEINDFIIVRVDWYIANCDCSYQEAYEKVARELCEYITDICF